MKFEKKKKRNSINKDFDSEPVLDEKHLGTKIESYNGKINTTFHNNKIAKEGSRCIPLSAILIDSVYRKDKDYYPQVFLEEREYFVKEKKASKFINDNIEISSDNSDKEDCDEENSDKENLMKKTKY